MTNSENNQSPNPGADWLGPTQQNVLGIYILYLLSFALGGVTAIVGVVVAYINRGKGGGVIIDSHYTYQIRSFWILLVYSLIGVITMIIGVGFLILVAAAVWFIVRCIKGLQWSSAGTPVPDPQTWLI